jgi:hypothetical protein
MFDGVAVGIMLRCLRGPASQTGGTQRDGGVSESRALHVRERQAPEHYKPPI